jgi:nitrogen-specific signal transduction histidine kinase
VPKEVQAALQQNYGHAQLGMPQRGQGLTIVKLFAVMHNGRVVCDSSDEKSWTVFRVLLPLE